MQASLIIKYILIAVIAYLLGSLNFSIILSEVVKKKIYEIPAAATRVPPICFAHTAKKPP